MLKIAPPALPPGTRVRVEQLLSRFRRRGASSCTARSEYAACKDVVHRPAMARPDITPDHGERRASSPQPDEA
jgi:DNA mismatch repair protein MutL